MKTLGSFLSAIVGWCSFNVVGLVYFFFVPGGHSTHWDAPIIALYSAAAVFFVWLTVLWPLYMRVPANSLLWRWPICTLCGVACAILLCCALLPLFGFRVPSWEAFSTSLYVGSIIGGTTCLFGSLTAPFFRTARRA